jgi:hypothetical protein
MLLILYLFLYISTPFLHSRDSRLPRILRRISPLPPASSSDFGEHRAPLDLPLVPTSYLSRCAPPWHFNLSLCAPEHHGRPRLNPRPPLQTSASDSWSTRPRGPRQIRHCDCLEPMNLLVSFKFPVSSYNAGNGRRPDLAVGPLTSSCAPTHFQETIGAVVHTIEFPASCHTPSSTP